MFKTNIKQIMTKPQTTDFFITCKESRIENNTSFYGCFYLGPFDENLSQTLANDLRRSLLSELTGFAITSIEIEGVLHKFSHVPGMKDTVLDLICNLQAIVLKKQQMSEPHSYKIPNINSSDTFPTSFYTRYEDKHFGAFKITKKIKSTYSGFLNVSGPRVITAKDLKLPAGLQCVDPNQYIATLTEDGMLNMKFQVNQGKNYIKQKPYNLDLNVLKKRNILLQNFKNILSDKNLSVARSDVRQTFGRTYAKNSNFFSEREDLSTQRPKEALLKTNPIPLDAVFMPVTKINCIIEENNIYSDFSTDMVSDSFANPSSQDLNNSYLQNKNEDPLLTMGLKSFKDFNSLRVNLAKTKSVGEVSQFIQTQTDVFQNVRFIPWQKNDIYFDTVKILNFGDKLLSHNIKKSYNQYFKSKSKIKLFLACNKITTFSEFKKNAYDSNFNTARLPSLSLNMAGLNSASDQNRHINRKYASKNKTIPNAWLGFKLLTNNNILDKPFINNLLTISKKTPIAKHDQNNFLLTHKPYVYGTSNSSAVFDNTSGYSKPTFKLNSIDGIIHCSQKMEYQQFLKLKPLQKKTNLIVEIWTNGSLHPRHALEQAFAFLSDNFLKLQTTKKLGSVFKSEISYSTLKYSLFNNWNASASKLVSSSEIDYNTTSNFYTAVQTLEPNLSKNLHTSLDDLSGPFVGVSKTYGKKRNSSFSSHLVNNKKKSLAKQNNDPKDRDLSADLSPLKSTYSVPKDNKFNEGNNLNYTPISLKNKFLLAPIEILKIPNLILYTTLKKVGIFTLKDLVQYNKEDLLKIICSINDQRAILGSISHEQKLELSEVEPSSLINIKKEINPMAEPPKGNISLNNSLKNVLGSSEYSGLKSLFLIEKNLSYLGLTLKNF